MIPTPRPRERGLATSADGTRIAWYRYGGGERAILFVPTWNLVDARAVLAAAGIERASLVTASRGLNAGVRLVTDEPERFERLAAVAPCMRLEAEPAPPDPEWLEKLRTDWPRFMLIPDGGHRPDIRSPEIVNQLLLDFLLLG